MSADNSNQLLPQNCLDVLTHMLDLAMQTADAASADKNHKLVLQAVREVTRLVTLINKITTSSAQKPAPKPGPALGKLPRAEAKFMGDNWEKSGKTARKTGSIELFFEENKLHNRQGKSFSKAAASNAGANLGIRQAADAACAIHWQDKPVILAAAEAEAA
jgi:hypothetical protein